MTLINLICPRFPAGCHPRGAGGKDQQPELRDPEQRGGHETAGEQRPQRAARPPAQD